MYFHIRHPKTKEIVEFDEKLRNSNYMKMLFKDGWEEVEWRAVSLGPTYTWVKKHDDKSLGGKG